MRFFSFEKEACHYANHCLAQRFFAQRLADKIACRLGLDFVSVVDLGCGTGLLSQVMAERGIRVGAYQGCDLSKSMLQDFVSPYASELFLQDFDVFLRSRLERGEAPPSLVVSSSSLQWARDLRYTFALLAQSASDVALSVITDSTFASLHRFLGSRSPLMPLVEVRSALCESFCGEWELQSYVWQPQDPRSALEHLRRSGVMGGGVLDYRDAKRLLSYCEGLEYESLIFVGRSRVQTQENV